MRESVTVPGPACARLAEAARSAGVVLVIGVSEREENGGTIYHAVLTFAPDGSLLGRHIHLARATRRAILGRLGAVVARGARSV